MRTLQVALTILTAAMLIVLCLRPVQGIEAQSPSISLANEELDLPRRCAGDAQTTTRLWEPEVEHPENADDHAFNSGRPREAVRIGPQPT